MGGPTASGCGSAAHPIPVLPSKRKDEDRETAFVSWHRAGGTDYACPPPSSVRPELRALLYAGRVGGRSHDSGLAQWHSDPYHSSHFHVRRHDFHCSSQAQSVQAERTSRRIWSRLVRWRPLI